MSIWYWQALTIYTSNEEATIQYVLEQGKLYGFIYNTHIQINVSIEDALEYIKLGDEDEGHRIYVEYEDATFTLSFFFSEENPSLYISLSPPNSTWTLASLDCFIDNAHYVKLLLYLSKNLPISDVIVYSEYDALPKPGIPNTINIYMTSSNIETLINNIYRHNYKTNTNIEKFAHYDLNNKIEPITFTIKAYSYNIKICITQDIFYLTALEPYAIKVIDNQTYIDAALYVKIALAIYDTLPIIAMNTNFILNQQ